MSDFRRAVLAALGTKSFGRTLECYREVSSTQDLALRLAQNNALEGTVVVSNSQTQGRGRFGRQWLSLPGGLYFSIILRPEFKRVADIGSITMVAGLSLLEAIKEATSLQCRLKWPNDILLYGKKVCGILANIDFFSGNIRYIVIGVGLNISNRIDDLSEVAVTLESQTQQPVSPVNLLTTALRRLEEDYYIFSESGFIAFKERWLANAAFIEEPITVKCFDQSLRGIIDGVSDLGQLRLRLDDGQVKLISSPDIVIA